MRVTENDRRTTRHRLVAVLGVTLLLAAVAVVLAQRPAPDDRSPVAAGLAPATEPIVDVTVDACRNSHDPACGPFSYDGALAPDRPMTVDVTVDPALPRVGQQVTFHVVLHDPDGVSFGGTIFTYGGAAIGSQREIRCEKYGRWDPPSPDPSRATESQDVIHTYAEPGTYTARFTFEAGPVGCVDGRTGRGELPYASTGSGSVTVTVLP